MRHTSKIQVFVAAALLAFASACGGISRNTDNYRADEVQDELGKIQAIAGTYSGTLVSRATNQTIGLLTIELSSARICLLATLFPIRDNRDQNLLRMLPAQGRVHPACLTPALNPLAF